MRLYTFGCSFTKYHWPTWADILAREYDHFENWAQPGAGNHFIFNSLIECIQRNKVDTDDTVMIMWTSIVREDRYCGRTWITPGNIYSQNTYPEEFVKKFADNRGYLIRDLAFIDAARLILEKIGCKYKFLSMIPIENVSEFANTLTVKHDKDCLHLYSKTLQSIQPSVFEIVFRKNWASRPRYASQEAYYKEAGSDWPSFDDYLANNFANLAAHIKKEVISWGGPWGMGVYDCHPIPILHAEYLHKIGLSLSNETLDWTNQINDALLSNKDLGKLWNPKNIQRL